MGETEQFPPDFSTLVDELDALERQVPNARYTGYHARWHVEQKIRLAQARAVEHVAERLDKLIELLFDEGRAIPVRDVDRV